MGTENDATTFTIKNPEQVIKNIDKEREDILFARNKQYSADNDFTANFNDTAAIARTLKIDISGRDVAMVLAILKMVRDSNAHRAGITLDDRRDHLIDLHNYIDLAHLCEINDERFKKLQELVKESSNFTPIYEVSDNG